MGDLDEAIREHLELKRRRGADPAEVAREEQEALAPVTRRHAIVVPEDLDAAALREGDLPRNGDAQHDADYTNHDSDPTAHHAGPPQHDAPGTDPPAHEDLGDATQEFRVVHDDPDDWLGEGDEG
jgi:Flp pilus assembly protein TadD